MVGTSFFKLGTCLGHGLVLGDARGIPMATLLIESEPFFLVHAIDPVWGRDNRWELECGRFDHDPLSAAPPQKLLPLPQAY
jgi:hypothetical protein